MKTLRLGSLLLLFLTLGCVAHAQISGPEAEPIPGEIAEAVKRLPPARFFAIFNLGEWRKTFPDTPDNSSTQVPDPAAMDERARNRAFFRKSIAAYTAEFARPVISNFGWKPEEIERVTVVHFDATEGAKTEAKVMFLEGSRAISGVPPVSVLEPGDAGRIVIAQISERIVVIGQIETVASILRNGPASQSESGNSELIDTLNNTSGFLRGYFDFRNLEDTDDARLGRVFFGVGLEDDELIAHGLFRMDSSEAVTAVYQKYTQGLIEALTKANGENAAESDRAEARIFLKGVTLESAGLELRFRFGEEALIKVLEGMEI